MIRKERVKWRNPGPLDSACPSAAVAKTVTGTAGQGARGPPGFGAAESNSDTTLPVLQVFHQKLVPVPLQYRHPQQLDRQPLGRERLRVRTGWGPRLEGRGPGLRPPFPHQLAFWAVLPLSRKPQSQTRDLYLLFHIQR